MIRYNDDEDYDPVAPFFVMTQWTPTQQPATAGPIPELSAAIAVWGNLAPSGPDMGFLNLIFDGTGLAIFGFKRDEMRPPVSFGGVWIPTIPTVLVASCPIGARFGDFLFIIDTLREQSNGPA